MCRDTVSGRADAGSIGIGISAVLRQRKCDANRLGPLHGGRAFLTSTGQAMTSSLIMKASRKMATARFRGYCRPSSHLFCCGKSAVTSTGGLHTSAYKSITAARKLERSVFLTNALWVSSLDSAPTQRHRKPHEGNEDANRHERQDDDYERCL